ncbi:hypothetical protein PQX77_011643 [Marasmius sp. AFHP31]|nr:hypothetical protein PQX77_011643 [Marasmius sp. AFHP31]
MAQLPDSPFGRFFNVYTPPTPEQRNVQQWDHSCVHSLENEISRLQTLAEDLIFRRFRDVALSTPRLWNSIHFTILPSYNDPKDFTTEEYIARVSYRWDGVELWLERSAALPLSFSLVLERKIYERNALGGLLAVTKLLEDQHLEDNIFKLSKETPHLHSLALAAALLPGVRSPERVNNSIVFSKFHTLEFRLETLWFYAEADIGEVAFTQFFDSIHTPMLRRLSIMIQELEDISVTWKCIQVAPFRDLISRVSAGLQDLCLDVPMTFETLVDCLGRL